MSQPVEVYDSKYTKDPTDPERKGKSAMLELARVFAMCDVCGKTTEGKNAIVRGPIGSRRIICEKHYERVEDSDNKTIDDF